MALAIVMSVIFYTQMLVDELIKREQKAITLYTEIFSRYATPEETIDGLEYLYIIESITSTISFPIIATDENDVPIYDFESNTLNVELDYSLEIEEQRKILVKMIEDMGDEYKPIIVKNKEGDIIAKFYYANSDLITKLKFFPYVEIAILAIFIVIGYLSFSYIRRNEETKVWVGMAKEAAHQLGTPLSSLLAWLELLKYDKENPQQIENIISEMENDIDKLNTIATRFSKIGSKPERTFQNIAELIEHVSLYFEKRLPHLGKKVIIERYMDYSINADVNYELLQWVIENLLKNAAESIESDIGRIEITMELFKKDKLAIFIRDNGKGMNSKVRSQAFFPGFTTKKRGWGIGLSLCKRIIEQYHNGRIYIRDSAIGKGTTFVIELPINQK